MPTVFFLTQLKEGIDPKSYEEKWIFGYDYPTVKTVPCILSYQYYRIDGIFRSAPIKYHYMEVIEVNDLDEYRQALESLPNRQELVQEVADWVQVSHSYWGEPIPYEDDLSLI